MKIEINSLEAYLATLNESTCPLCGNTDWDITDKVFKVAEFDNDQSTIPIVPLVCTNCGNTYFINALVAKLIVRDSVTEKPPEKQTTDNSRRLDGTSTVRLHRQLLEVGDDLALNRGGRCYDFTMDRTRKMISFKCIDDGEKYSIDMSFREVESVFQIPGRILFEYSKDERFTEKTYNDLYLKEGSSKHMDMSFYDMPEK